MTQQSAPAAGDAQAAQIGLTAVIGAGLTQAITRIDIADVSGSMPEFFALVKALVHRYGQASATLAARYYITRRTAAGLPPIHVKPASLPPLPQVDATLGWATTPLRETGDLATTESNVKGAVDRLVLDVGRRTLTDAVQSDRKARGWARLTKPDACSFCRLMATRGAVYKTEETAGRGKPFIGEGEFKFHDHCACGIEPVFGVYEMTAQARSDLALYKDAAKGLSGKAARNAFRQAVEGRLPEPAHAS